MYRAGSVTTATSILTFLLAMVLNPSVQRKAMDEIDSVIGRDRLPTFDDWDSLPYLDAVFKEVLRWNAPLPIGIPHRLMQSDVYKGTNFRAGSIVISKISEILHDPAIYAEPKEFVPERYLDDSEAHKLPHPSEAVFGFGRRICPGRYFAESTIFITMASILSLFEIAPPLDENGNEKRVEAKFTQGFGSDPVSLACRLIPRENWATINLEPTTSA